MNTFVDVYYAASYVRLSKDDGDRGESNSITNQKELIKNFVITHPEITVVEEYSDDGFSGVDFERPDFKRMIEDIKAKKINCIIVKDLSRFGRNYIETGKYIEYTFPLLGVRFIAINDNYDSKNKSDQSGDIIIPFKNLINDTYSRDVSVKTRSSLNTKRKKGDFVGSFAPFGYKKSEDNKNKLIIDEPAASIVKRVFRLKVDGKSNQQIADLLNLDKVPTPYAYKLNTTQGKSFQTGFEVHANPVWSVPAILRILTNEVYLGHLIQGKRIRPNYKIKKQIEAPADEWFRSDHMHEPITTQDEFDLVQSLLQMDTRVAPGKDELYIFSGIMRCPECGEYLTRRCVSSKKKKYAYYGCYTKGRKMKCGGIVIREDDLQNVVLKLIRDHIELIIEASEILAYVDQIPLHQKQIKEIDEQLKKSGEEVQKYKRLKSMLYADYREEIISQEEYIELKNIYSKEEVDLEVHIKQLNQRREDILNGKSDSKRCLEVFKKYRNLEMLDRRTVVSLIKRIDIYPDKKVNIFFRFNDECKRTRFAAEL